jgi:parallel beta-helix repeat protein
MSGMRPPAATRRRCAAGRTGCTRHRPAAGPGVQTLRERIAHNPPRGTAYKNPVASETRPSLLKPVEIASRAKRSLAIGQAGGGSAIDIGAANNRIVKNRLTDNGDGIIGTEAHDNLISHNTVTGTGFFGFPDTCGFRIILDGAGISWNGLGIDRARSAFRFGTRLR